MKSFAWSLSLGALLTVLVAGCGGQAAPPAASSAPASRAAAGTSSPASAAASAPASAAAKPSTSPAAPASAAGGANASAAAAPSPASPAAWQEIVGSAKKEATIAVLAQGGTEVSKGLTEAFEKAYPEIKVEITAGNGSEVSSKMLTERAAGRFTSDIIVHGTTTIVNGLLPAGALDPMTPFLVGPNDSDPSK